MPKLRKKGDDPQPAFLPNTLRIGALCAKRKAKDVRAYDVRGLTVVADSLVLCTASSEPHFKAVYNEVREGMKEVGVAPLRSEGTTKGAWLVIDYGDIVFHLFREEAREFYDLDGLWADAPVVDLDLG